jgi:N-acetylglutamate synthase-like GNAT family acetyltransferase
MIFRKYQLNDRDVCLELFRSNTPKFFAAYEEQEFREYLEHPEFYFILENPSILGCGGYALVEAQAFLTWGMIHNSQHGTGAGKRLLLERLNLITQHSEAKEVLLDTSQHTFGFFEKLGFVTMKLTEDGYAPGLNRYDMKLVLEEGSRQHLATLLLGTKGFANGVVNHQKKDNQHDK